MYCRYRRADLSKRFWLDSARYGITFDRAWRRNSQFSVRSAFTTCEEYLQFPLAVCSFLRESFCSCRWSLIRWKTSAAQTLSADFVFSIRASQRKWAFSRSELLMFGMVLYLIWVSFLFIHSGFFGFMGTSCAAENRCTVRTASIRIWACT